MAFSNVTHTQFFTAVLQKLGAPVTQNNLTKMAAVAKLEGSGGTYNPFNYVTATKGSTPFNYIGGKPGVQNYPDAATGVAMTARLLSSGHTTAWRNNLLSNGSYGDWINATKHFYASWGGNFPNVSPQSANTYLNRPIKGTPGATLQAGLAGIPTPASVDPATQAQWQSANQNAFTTWLHQQPTATQTDIVTKLRSNMTMPQIAALQNKYGSSVSDYVNFLSQVGPTAKSMTAGLAVGTSGTPTQPTPAPKPSPEMTSLLGRFGVQYPTAPQPTPALLAFLRGVGLSLDTASDLKTKAEQRINAATTSSMSDINRTAGRTKQNITADLVRRGVLSSGESNTRYANQAQDVAAQQSNVQQAAAVATGTAEDTYRQAQDAVRQQALERVIGSEQDQQTAAATAKAQADALKAQQDASDLSYARQQLAQANAQKAQISAINSAAAQGYSV